MPLGAGAMNDAVRILTRGVWTWPPALQVIGTFGIVLLPAGHGVLPAGAILFLGLERLPLPAWTGWLGIAAVGATLIPPGARQARRLAPIGLAFLLVSCLEILRLSEAAIVTLASMVPFLACSGLLLSRTLRRPVVSPPGAGGSVR